jgi:hypothetical protein
VEGLLGRFPVDSGHLGVLSQPIVLVQTAREVGLVSGNLKTQLVVHRILGIVGVLTYKIQLICVRQWLAHELFHLVRTILVIVSAPDVFLLPEFDEIGQYGY